ncbi:hypothetical protein ACH61_02490 [Rathayibacter tanaceti]|uniref:Uncharacterized protein n=1 Tax=Rathayibacter tanaceti TaxID=1671680 RepID=A0A162FW43_9MICO|nr:hypothetical protein ACH61_02490 [Rathayibacter tanaceti]
MVVTLVRAAKAARVPRTVAAATRVPRVRVNRVLRTVAVATRVRSGTVTPVRAGRATRVLRSEAAVVMAAPALGRTSVAEGGSARGVAEAERASEEAAAGSATSRS